MIPVNLAIEDELSELVLRKILSQMNRYAVGYAYRRGGFGYLRSTISRWNSAAKGTPFIVLTDLDRSECPATLIKDWLMVPRHPNLIFRIAVREIEAWLLADRSNFARFLSVPEKSMPFNVDELEDPKLTLIRIARTSKSSQIRERLTPKIGSTAKQGPDHNGRLGLFVQRHWDFETAKIESPSLNRTLQRLITFKPVWK